MSGVGPDDIGQMLRLGREMAQRRAARRMAEGPAVESDQTPAEQAMPKAQTSRRVALPIGSLLLLVACVGVYELTQLAYRVEVTEERVIIFLVFAGLWAGLFVAAGVVLFLVYLTGKAEQERARLAAQRRLVWEQVTAEWEQAHLEDRQPLDFYSTRQLSPAALEEFAAQVFRRAGYQATVVGRSGDHGVDVWLQRPSGEIEIVQCKQYDKPVGERVVRELLGTMHGEKAIRAHLWAPGGFTRPARRWAAVRPIELADEREIARKVEIAYRGEKAGRQ